MSGDDKSITDSAATAPVTSDSLRNKVLDHLLDNSDLYLSGGGGADKLMAMLERMTDLAMDVARESIVNRQNIYPLQTFERTITSDVEEDQTDQNYELRFRIIEQLGNSEPFNDQVMTLAEACDTYGEGFVERHWGLLGENSPSRVTTQGDRIRWFTVCRYPVDPELKQSANIDNANAKRSPSL